MMKIYVLIEHDALTLVKGLPRMYVKLDQNMLSLTYVSLVFREYVWMMEIRVSQCILSSDLDRSEYDPTERCSVCFGDLDLGEC